MMRTTLMLLMGVALTLAAPQSGRNRSNFKTIPKAPRSPISNLPRSPIPNSPRNLVPILVDERNMPDENGRFDFRYQTGDGISHQAQGNPVGDKSYSVQGSYSYTSPEGQLVEVRYIADDNGFQAFGDHLPTPPPMPAHALAQIRAAEQAFAGQRSGGSAAGLRRAPPNRLG